MRDIARQAEVSAETGREAVDEESEMHSSRVSSLVDACDDVHGNCDVGELGRSASRNWTRLLKHDTPTDTGNVYRNWTRQQKLETSTETGHVYRNWTRLQKQDTSTDTGNTYRNWTRLQKLDTSTETGNVNRNWTRGNGWTTDTTLMWAFWLNMLGSCDAVQHARGPLWMGMVLLHLFGQFLGRG